MAYDVLFQPLRIGGLTLKNRLVMSAMGSNLAEPDGTPGPRLIEFLVTRARGGVAMVIVETTNVTREVRYNARTPALDTDAGLPRWKELTRAIHAAGALAAVQLQHPGRQTLPGISTGEVVGPSPVPLRVTGVVPRELGREEIRALSTAFAAAAARARAAGFDAVEIHGGHGYIFQQFLSPYSNRRQDEYGGSLANRARFLLETVTAVREAAGADFPILVRLSAEEWVEGGLRLDDSVAVARMLARAGVAALRISGGQNDQSLPVMIPPSPVPRGLFWGQSEAIRRAAGIPVDAVGRINTPELAEDIIASGRADFISLGRALLADPDFPAKAAAGAAARIRPCIGCNQGCIDRVVDPKRQTISCLMNPRVGRELETLAPCSRSLHVVVVGGGPAGMQTALTAVQRGCRVTLLEAGARLGGEFRLAAIPPGKEDFARAVTFLERELAASTVHVETGRRAEVETVLKLRPDAVIVATGARRIPPDLPGAPPMHALAAVLDGHAPVGRRVAVLGSRWAGAEVAEWLATQGHEVTLVEPGEKIGADMSPVTVRWFARQRLERLGVHMLTGAAPLGWSSGRLRLRTPAGELQVAADSLVYEGYRMSDRNLFEALTGRVPRVLSIGDCHAPRTALEALHEGFAAAAQL